MAEQQYADDFEPAHTLESAAAEPSSEDAARNALLEKVRSYEERLPARSAARQLISSEKAAPESASATAEAAKPSAISREDTLAALQQAVVSEASEADAPGEGDGAEAPLAKLRAAVGAVEEREREAEDPEEAPTPEETNRESPRVDRSAAAEESRADESDEESAAADQSAVENDEEADGAGHPTDDGTEEVESGHDETIQEFYVKRKRPSGKLEERVGRLWKRAEKAVLEEAGENPTPADWSADEEKSIDGIRRHCFHGRDEELAE
eukprot:scaffold8462_cov229-Pinguiococcus_pyrenoidosus.AAC.1